MIITGIGRLSKDPKMAYTPKGTAQTTFNLAVDSGWGDNKKTIWLSMICWGNQAEIVNEKFSKGQRMEFAADATELYTFTRDDGTVGGSVNAKLLTFGWVDKSEKKNDPVVENDFEFEE
jgi:Single-stranded DNA-binding protein